jgi:hypothetical protein
MGADISFDSLLAIIGNKLGVFNVQCPLCSPHRRKKHLRCLRVWHEEPDFITYNCKHCDARGFLHPARAIVSPVRRKRLQAQADERNVIHHQKQRRKARWLWQGAAPIQGTLAEKYLRSRGIKCPLPSTLRFRPARGVHPPAMISAFGIPAESIPGRLDVAQMQISDLHITRLRADGLDKADVDNPKITLAPSSGLPIVCAPVNDLGGLAICEGIEDALAIHQQTGLGAWAAGCANRLPPLARAVPRYVESVIIAIDDDDDGRRHAYELSDNLQAIRGRDFEIREYRADRWRAAA